MSVSNWLCLAVLGALTIQADPARAQFVQEEADTLHSTASTSSFVPAGESLQFAYSGGQYWKNMGDVATSGDFVYCPVQHGLQVFRQWLPDSLSLIAQVLLPGSRFRGFCLNGSHAYLARGNAGLFVVDVSNPFQPFVAGHIDLPGNSSDVAVWSNVACVADSQSEAVHIIDISNVGLPVLASTVSLVDPPITLSMEAARAYVAVGIQGMVIINAADAYHPFIEGQHDPAGDRTHQVVALGNVAYAAGWEIGLYSVDISTPSFPTPLGNLNTPALAYLVMVNPPNLYLVESGSWFLNGDARLYSVDVSDPIHPIATRSHYMKRASFGMAMSGDFLLSAQIDSGLYVYDVSDPDTIRLSVAHYTPGLVRDIETVGERAFVAMYSDGVKSLTELSAPLLRESAAMDTPGRAVAVSADLPYLYEADGASGLQIIDVSDSTVMTQVANLPVPGVTWDLMVTGGYAYLGTTNGLSIADVTTPASPSLLASVPTDNTVFGLAFAAPYIYMTHGDLTVVDVSNPSQPAVVGDLQTPDFTHDVVVSGQLAYLASDSGGGIQVVDISVPSAPVLIGQVDTPGRAFAIELSGPFLYVADGESGVTVVRISDPTQPTVVAQFDTPGSAIEVALADSLVLVADHYGLLTLKKSFARGDGNCDGCVNLVDLTMLGNALDGLLDLSGSCGEFNLDMDDDGDLDELDYQGLMDTLE